VSRLKAGSAVSELKLQEGKNLVVVDLPPTSTNPRRSHALKKQDEVMSSVLDKVGAAADFVAVYTARGSSISTAEEVPHMRVARALQQARIGDPTSPDTFYHNDCIFIYLRDQMTLSMHGEKGPHAPIPARLAVDEIPGGCEGDKNHIKLKYSNVTLGGVQYHKLNLDFQFTQVGGHWHSPTVEVSTQKGAQHNNEYTKTTLRLNRNQELGAPVGHCFSCGETLVYHQQVAVNGTKPAPKTVMNLRMNGVQIQAFMGAATQFGDSWDCSGFFTPGVWMGLIASGMATAILLYGMCMITDIKTMDRFDDPKGKPIMLTQAQD